MSHILAVYTAAAIEYKELSRHNGLINTMFALESLLSEYQITYGGKGNIDKYRFVPDKHLVKEGLYIIQAGLNRIILFNRRRSIGYLWNDFMDDFIAEFVIIRVPQPSDNYIIHDIGPQELEDFEVHKQNMNAIFRLIMDDNFKLPPVKILENSTILKV